MPLLPFASVPKTRLVRVHASLRISQKLMAQGDRVLQLPFCHVLISRFWNVLVPFTPAEGIQNDSGKTVVKPYRIATVVLCRLRQLAVHKVKILID